MPKSSICNVCNSTFETSNGLGKHNRNKHPDYDWKIKSAAEATSEFLIL